MTVRIRQRSRLQLVDLLTVDGVEFWDLPVYPEVKAQPDDVTYTVIASDRLDTLADQFYQDPTLWWVIALANGWEDLPGDMNVGDSIRIPAPRYVLQEYFAQVNR